MNHAELVQVDEIIELSKSTFGRHITAVGDDLTLLTLKGHLLIENAVDDLLKAVLPNPNKILKNRQFAFKVDLLEAAIEPPAVILEYVVPLRALSTARNHLAHDLEAVDLEKKLWSFIKSEKMLAFRNAYAESHGGPLSDNLPNEYVIALTNLYVTCYVERNIRRELRKRKIAIRPE